MFQKKKIKKENEKIMKNNVKRKKEKIGASLQRNRKGKRQKQDKKSKISKTLKTSLVRMSMFLFYK